MPEGVRGDELEREGSAPARPGRHVPALLAPLAAAAAVEALAHAGLGLPDPRPLFYVAVVYAALAGGLTAAFVAVIFTSGYVAYYDSPYGPPHPGPAGPLFRSMMFLVTAAAVSGMVLLLRARAEGAARRTLTRHQEGAARSLANSLADRDALNRAVLGALPVHIAVLDPQGTIVSTNEAWDRFGRGNGRRGTDGAGNGAATGAVASAGVNYLQVCRESVDRPVPAPEAPQVAQGIAEVLAGRQNRFTLEYPCDARSGDGEPGAQRWFLMTVTPLPWTDVRGATPGDGPTRLEGLGAVVTHLDITGRKLTEQSLRRRATELAAMAAALKSSNEELDQFAYITSHDLRAPLRGIANLSNWIEEDMGERFTPEAHKQMELLRGRVHRMEAMIDGILEYSRVGRVRSAAQQVDVAQLLREVVDLLDPPAGFTVDLAPGMPVILGEKLRLQQVFQNLIGNALKHHDKQAGRIQVACREVTHEAGPWYEFSVTDDGPGIPPQYHERIFTIFQTLQPRDKVEGTGVGLALVRKIVQDQGGVMAVESEPGRGSTFRFTWPARGGPPDPQTTQDAAPPVGRAHSTPAPSNTHG